MTPASLDAGACAAFLIVAFAIAGCAQTTWLASSVSRRLAWPVDAGITIAGRRLFGPNKTLRGFVVMVPATGLAFAVLAGLTPVAGRWPLSPSGYGALGVLAALGFLIAELPNSCLKRQLDIPPGAAAAGPIARHVFFVMDHIDSPCGVLAALALVVPVPAWTVVYVLLTGAVIHIGFSRLTFELGGKARAA